jgi:hypothetical protein
MLANVLALAVALGSIALYLTAFVFPTLHRKQDFIWSGVGLFYALVLWVCSGRITGAVLLGQTASVALLGWFAWQTVLLRSQAATTDGSPSPIDKLVSWANDTESTGVLAQVKGVIANAIAFFQSLMSNASTPSESGSNISSGSSSFSNILADLQQKILLLVATVKERISPSETTQPTSAPAEPKEVYVRKKFRETPAAEPKAPPAETAKDESPEPTPAKVATGAEDTPAETTPEPQSADTVSETSTTEAVSVSEPVETAQTSEAQSTDVVTEAESGEETHSTAPVEDAPSEPEPAEVTAKAGSAEEPSAPEMQSDEVVPTKEASPSEPQPEDTPVDESSATDSTATSPEAEIAPTEAAQSPEPPATEPVPSTPETAEPAAEVLAEVEVAKAHPEEPSEPEPPTSEVVTEAENTPSQEVPVSESEPVAVTEVETTSVEVSHVSESESGGAEETPTPETTAAIAAPPDDTAGAEADPTVESPSEREPTNAGSRPTFDQQVLERCHKPTQMAINAALQVAARFGFTEIRPQDLLIGFLRVENGSDIIKVAQMANMNYERTYKIIEENYNQGSEGEPVELGDMRFNPSMSTILETALQEAERKANLPLQPAQLFLTLIQTSDPDVQGILTELQVNLDQLQDDLRRILIRMEAT